MDFIKAFGEDKKTSVEGKWFALQEDGEVKVAKHNNHKFRAELAMLQKQNLHKMRVNNSNSMEIAEDLINRATAKTVLVDWRDIKMNGDDIPYSSEKAYELLTNFPDFKAMITFFSSDRDNFTAEDSEELVGK